MNSNSNHGKKTLAAYCGAVGMTRSYSYISVQRVEKLGKIQEDIWTVYRSGIYRRNVKA